MGVFGRRGGEAGFSLVEMLVAAALVAIVAATLIGVAGPARAMFQAQPEITDMHQRLRAALDALTRDLLAAGAGLDPAEMPAVVPYRIGARDSDAAAGIFYRSDAITVRNVPWSGTGVVSRTYELERDAASGVSHIVQYDGGSGEFPMVDHVVALSFTYTRNDGTVVDASELQDGPWIGTGIGRFDEDLLAVRRVSVALRVEAALAFMRGTGQLFVRAGTSTAPERYAPDQQVVFGAALRNATPGR